MRIYAWILLGLSVLFFNVSIYAATATIRYTVNGVAGPMLQNILNRLNDEQKHVSTLSTIEGREKLLQQSPDTVKAALQPYGYFHPTISHKIVQESSDLWHIFLNITLGQPVTIRKVQLNISGAGANKSAFIQFKENYPLKVGDILNTEKYDHAKTKLATLSNDLGFLQAHYISRKIIIDKEHNTAQIIIDYTTGPQFYFGAIDFQQSLYNEDFLKRFLSFKVGDVYSPKKLIKLQQDLTGTTYFKQVIVKPKEQKTTSQSVPIDIILKPSQSQIYKFGIGYGTDTDFRITTAWDWRHITDTGQHMKTYLQLSQVQSSIDSRYVIPGENPLTDQYYIGASLIKEVPNSSEGNTQKLTVGKQDLLGEWKRTLTLSYQHDRYSIRKDPFTTTDLIVPGITLYRNHYDNVIFPRHGTSTTIVLRGGAGNYRRTENNIKDSGHTGFAQLQISPKIIFSPSNNNRILLRGDIGYTAIDDPNNLPLSLQFFAGGTDSVRGYDYQQLGPGKYLIVGSAEYQHRVWRNIFGTTFIDSGNAINNLHTPADNRIGTRQPSIHLSDLLKTSIGVGIMYASPIGPLELTIAKPLTDIDKSIQIQFRMGANL